MKNKSNRIKYIGFIPVFFLFTLASQWSIANEHKSSELNTEHYQVMDNKVDPATFIGWSVFHNSCVSCHGVGAVGSADAPDLLEAADRFSPEQFKLKVLHKKIVKFTGDDWRNMEQAMFEEIAKQQNREQGDLANMPRWEHNPAVKDNVNNIYRYLKARADGAIGPEKPGVLK